MIILNVFSKKLCITYKSNLFSKATFIAVVLKIISFALPFMLLYHHKSFWLQTNSFYEQPTVQFTGEYLFLATTNNARYSSIICSSKPGYEEMVNPINPCPITRVREIDTEFDGKNDEFEFVLHVNLPSNTEITSFTVIILLDYMLTTCPLQMLSAIIYQNHINQQYSRFVVQSDLKLKQSTLLTCDTEKSYSNYTVINNSENPRDINAIILEYMNRNVSTRLSDTYTNVIFGDDAKFSLELHIKFPKDHIFYRTNFFYKLKWAWIQYFSIYIIVAWCVSRLKTYIFQKKLVLYYEENPIKKKQ